MPRLYEDLKNSHEKFMRRSYEDHPKIILKIVSEFRKFLLGSSHYLEISMKYPS